MHMPAGRFLLLPMLLVFAAAPLPAQRPIQVEGIKNLAFGLLLAGTPMSVLRTDAVRAGQVNITAQPKSSIIIQISLPASMTGPAGATLPVSFGPNDAGYSALGAIGSQVAFDPRNSTVVLTNTSNGRGTLFVGGTASPAFNQQPGNYTGTITITVAYP
jgi:spore coat protein U-like protein